MALLLTSQGEFAEALDVVEQTLEEFPDNLSIIALKVFIGQMEALKVSDTNQSSCPTKPNLNLTTVQQNITLIFK